MNFTLCLSHQDKYGVSLVRFDVYRNELGDFRVKLDNGTTALQKFVYSLINNENWGWGDKYNNAARHRADFRDNTYGVEVWGDNGKRDKNRERIARRAFQAAVTDILGAY